MNRLNFRTLNFGHKAEHVIKTAYNQFFIIMYLIYIGCIYNITDALFFVKGLNPGVISKG